MFQFRSALASLLEPDLRNCIRGMARRFPADYARQTQSCIHHHFPASDLAVKIVCVAFDSNLCIAIATPDAFGESKAEPLFEEALAIHCMCDEGRKRGS